MDLSELEKIIDLYSEPTVLVDGQCRVLLTNREARECFLPASGTTQQERSFFDGFSDSQETLEGFIRDCMRTSDSVKAKLTPAHGSAQGGATICIGVVVKRGSDSSQNWVLVRCTGTDTMNTNFPVLTRTVDDLLREVEHRREAEERLGASLAEKDVLLKEIHHRVKNNLQIIMSLLNLQSSQIQDEDIQGLFEESKNRIATMALIHEKLYQSEDVARIDFGDYLENLISMVSESYTTFAVPVKFEVNIEEIYLDIDTAIPCALIVNELISNALKHAFAGGSALSGEECAIGIRITSDSETGLALNIFDNGNGFPEDIDFRETESLGLQIVNTLTQQLDGTIELHNNEGTAFEIRFQVASPVLNPEKDSMDLTQHREN